MRENPEKDTLIQSVLAFLAQNVPLEQALVASLGGEGREAGLWRAAGIQPANSYLIECSPRRMKTLLKEQQMFQLLQGRLARFPEVFLAQRGLQAGLDLFHADLCGTFDQNMVAETRSILPLLARGQGRCLAITVADKRRNHAQDYPQDTLAQAMKVFKTSFEPLCVYLTGLHRSVRAQCPLTAADPEKTMLRELGLLLNLENMFSVYSDSHRKVQLWPRRLERYILSSLGFRMRSYVMSLEEVPHDYHQPHAFAEELAKLVMQSPCYYLVNQERQLVVPEQVRPTERKEEKQMPEEENPETTIAWLYRYFEPALLVNAEAKAALDRLAKLARASHQQLQGVERLRTELAQSRRHVELLEEIRLLVTNYGLPPIEAESVRPKPAQAGPPPPPTQPVRRKRGRPRIKLPQATSHRVSPAIYTEKIETPVLDKLFADLFRAKIKSYQALDSYQCNLLRVFLNREERKGEAADQAARKLVAPWFKLRDKNGFKRNRVLGSFLASASGKFFPDFLAKVILETDSRDGQQERIVKELAAVYQFDTREEEFRKLIKASDYWKNNFSSR